MASNLFKNVGLGLIGAGATFYTGMDLFIKIKDISTFIYLSVLTQYITFCVFILSYTWPFFCIIRKNLLSHKNYPGCCHRKCAKRLR